MSNGFLFTASDVPVRSGFVVNDPVFRIERRMVMTQTVDSGLEAMAEYILKRSRCAEHENDTTEKAAEWEWKTRECGISTGTVIGFLSKDFMEMFGHVISK